MKQTTLRTVHFGALTLASVALLSSSAAAAPCDPTTLTCSVNDDKLSGLRVESTDALPTSIDSGWIPSVPMNDPNFPHGDKAIQVKADITFDRLESEDGSAQTPVYVIDMTKGTDVSVTWPTANEFVVQLEPNMSNDASLRVTHTLTPNFKLWFGKLLGISINAEVDLPAEKLIDFIPGSNFNYTATSTQSFAPWGFDGITTQVKGTDFNNSKLFDVTLQQLGDLVNTGNFSGVIEGSFSFNATTDSDFTFTTKSVNVIGGTGPITSETGTTTIPMNDGNFLEFQIQPTGTLTYSGDIELLPVANITSVFGFNFSVSFPISVGLDFPYTSDEIDVTFPSTLVHIPLPNVFVPSKTLDFGQVQGNNKADRKISIDNDGELGATLEYSSDNPAFTISQTSTQVGPEQSTDLTIQFRPTKPGADKGTITVKSNDPDSPEQTFDVQGFGVGEDFPEPVDPGMGGAGGSGGNPGTTPTSGELPESDSGCGCRTAGTDGPNPMLAWATLAGIGLISAGRRRNRR